MRSLGNSNKEIKWLLKVHVNSPLMSLHLLNCPRDQQRAVLGNAKRKGLRASEEELSAKRVANRGTFHRILDVNDAPSVVPTMPVGAASAAPGK